MTADTAIFPARLERLRRLIQGQDLEGILITSPVHVRYLTGFRGDASYLLVGLERLLLVSDGRFTQQLQEECPEVPLHIRPPDVRLAQATAECVNLLGWRRVGFEARHISVAEWEEVRSQTPAVTWKPTQQVVESLRQRKDDSELAQIREAIRIAERAFQRFRHSLRPEDTEKDLVDRMETLLRSEGAAKSSFPMIVAVGERSALPHCPPSRRALGEAPMVLVDWGAEAGGYCSDLTRVLTRRTISPQLRQVWSAVQAARARALAQLRPGVAAEAVDAAARAALAEAGLAEYFPHALGHGIGMEVHESPRLGAKVSTLLEPGMVVTIEPGVYLPGWGGVRLEDDVAITADGCEVLSQLSTIPEELTWEG
jgi:Xaa-Pro aminopeptidase